MKNNVMTDRTTVTIKTIERKMRKKDHKINHFLTMKEMFQYEKSIWKEKTLLKKAKATKSEVKFSMNKTNELPRMSIVNFIQFSTKKNPYAFEIPCESTINE